jgi:hypothetical protein
MKIEIKDEFTIKDFWEFNNVTCWRIKRSTLVDFYLYTPTMRYIYKNTGGIWKGTKSPYPAISKTEKERKKIKQFKDEDEAVHWLAGL